MHASVVAVSRSPEHTFSKPAEPAIHLVEGLGVEGDAHAGATVKHRSRVKRNPNEPNLRQVHLIHAELHDELRGRGFDVAPGQMGENVTTSGVDLLGLPKGTKLKLGDQAVIEITGLRDPCIQLDQVHTGLMQAVIERDADGNLIRKAGVMSVVLRGGSVHPGDRIEVELPPRPHEPLKVV
ncbi:MAG TPA: MOSC domain-containing protein [Chloroflexota bacterium]|jgi:MOSC domain-containing protein YiiM|nr:MOSC domain-containing protein [Chloroflexota bacterium]